VEYKLFRTIQKSVESLFEEGRPLHHLDSARSLEYDPEASAIYVTSERAFNQLSSQQIQEVFRRRHILIPATTPPDVKFDRKGLSTLGCLTTERQIQGELCFAYSLRKQRVDLKCSGLREKETACRHLA
jgi:hypothetical protein